MRVAFNTSPPWSLSNGFSAEKYNLNGEVTSLKYILLIMSNLPQWYVFYAVFSIQTERSVDHILSPINCNSNVTTLKPKQTFHVDLPLTKGASKTLPKFLTRQYDFQNQAMFVPLHKKLLQQNHASM